MLCGDGEERVKRAEPEVGGDGRGVDAERAGRIEPRARVRLAGAADVLALGVCQDEEPAFAGQGDEVFQGGVAD